MQLVLPESFRKQALQGCHDDLGHLGIEWTIDLLRDQILLAWNDGMIQLDILNNARDA